MRLRVLLGDNNSVSNQLVIPNITTSDTIYAASTNSYYNPVGKLFSTAGYGVEIQNTGTAQMTYQLRSFLFVSLFCARWRVQVLSVGK